MQQGRSQRLGACLLILSVSAAAETVVLRNGFRLAAERCERFSDRVRLLTANGGWIEILPDEVARIESEPVPQLTPSARTEAGPEPQRDLRREIERVAAKAGLPGDLIDAVAWAESGLRQDAVSPAGAIGLMQLMPDTAAELGVDPWDRLGNLAGGTRYLKQLLQRFSGDRDQLAKALAAYNAGPGRVVEHGGVPPYPETVAYIRRVVRRYLGSDVTGGQEPAGSIASAGEDGPTR